VYPGLACDRTSDGLIDCQHCPVGYYCGFIAAAAQKKMLEYLIVKFVLLHKAIGESEFIGWYIENNVNLMLEELEEIK
jgi:hypothetical protein